ncbi:MAG: glucosidase [Chitinophagaceae bacterium]|nr:glucosidase [Chitinophagaceae bacterium]
MSAEKKRLEESKNGIQWKKWGPYLSERQWGTVREDYSDHGNAWIYLPHEHSRSKAYRWGEDGIAGFCNDDSRICFSWAFWNHKDSILKERFFGLSGSEGNHGEDVKEIYYYLENTPTHSFMKMLYKYPQKEFPYNLLIHNNNQRTKQETEYEIIDTGIFDEDAYFDIFLYYAKADVEDFLFEAEIFNRGNEIAPITVLPTIWFRNTWGSGKDKFIPFMEERDKALFISHHILEDFYVYFQEEKKEIIFTDNETNTEKLHGTPNKNKYLKDAFHDYIINNKTEKVNPKKTGTKSAAVHTFSIPPKEKISVKVRFSKNKIENPFSDFESIMNRRREECDDFYKIIQEKIGNEQDVLPQKEIKNIQRQAYAGMLWTKQFYYYNVAEWIKGDPGKPSPPENRKNGRNKEWKHKESYDIISMPDKWEYPWYAAWDLAFHCIPLARVDTEFAKDQLLLLLQDKYMHPNGQIPAYEWNFSDVNPPVHAWAIYKVYKVEKRANNDKGDIEFLQKAFHRLLLNFNWWINRKDKNGSNIFEGGFLGLDNIGVFDRNNPIIEGSTLEQADSTSWVAMFSLSMLKIAIEIATVHPVYQDIAIKFFEHFLHIAAAVNNVDQEGISLWDNEDAFFYDLMHTKEQSSTLLKVRSIVGLIPLFAVTILERNVYSKLPDFTKKIDDILHNKPHLANLISKWTDPGRGERKLLAFLRGSRLKKILEKMLSTEEFLSEYGIRALSKYHKEKPYTIQIKNMTLTVEYLPGESDSSFFGGNSNWRGPIWFPINYLIMESIYKLHFYYGDDFKIEFPVKSGNYITLLDISILIAKRLIHLFLPNETENRPIYGQNEKFQKDPFFKNYILFYEYFHGDTGKGLGANHQTGWTGLIADIIHRYYNH